MSWAAPSEPASPWFDVGTDRVRLLRDGTEAFPTMLAAIRAAEDEILLEMYWVGADKVGTAFRDALVERARAGIRVRVIYDAVGSLALAPSWWDPLVRAGGEVRIYNPISPLHPSFNLARLEQRDHRKVLVVDDRRGFTGGINLARQWLPASEGGEAWRDDVIEVVGHAARELRTLFYKTWRRVGFHNFRRDPLGTITLPTNVVPLSKRPTGRVYVLASQRKSRRNLRREYLSRLNRAERSIDIANSYFIPDRHVRSALYRAVLRGVRVRVLVPSKSDVLVVQYALEALYESLLRNGVAVYCLGGPMMHAKTAIIDERFVTIGSYNLDERSAKNLEVNIAVEDRAFATHVREWFDKDLAGALELDLYEWRERPFVRRGMEYLAFAMRRLW